MSEPSTFLELCQRTAKEAGLEAETPTTVVGQTGDQALVVGWVGSAYREIVEMHKTWKFLWDEYEVDTTAENDIITFPTACRQPSFTDMIGYLKSAGITEGWHMTFKVHSIFRRLYRFQSESSAQPKIITRRPDGDLQVYPTPDDIYTIEFGGWQKAPELTADADEPLIPEEYRMAIVWRAVILAAGYHEAVALYQKASADYKQILSTLRREQLPDMTWTASALA